MKTKSTLKLPKLNALKKIKLPAKNIFSKLHKPAYFKKITQKKYSYRQIAFTIMTLYIIGFAAIVLCYIPLRSFIFFFTPAIFVALVTLVSLISVMVGGLMLIIVSFFFAYLTLSVPLYAALFSIPLFAAGILFELSFFKTKQLK